MITKCLRITIFATPVANVHTLLQKTARELGIEGTVQIADQKTIKIIACGLKENVDAFIDILHARAMGNNPKNIEVEPFVKERDYRKVFRIIE